MYASGERIHRVLLHSRVIDADFRIWDAAAVPGLRVRFVLYHAVAFRWSSRHRGKQVAGNMRARIGQESEPQVGFLVSNFTNDVRKKPYETGRYHHHKHSFCEIIAIHMCYEG